ncbi:MAG: hypothetical protein E6772_00905 [Dysgonomonas sp.]|nr:hypothetical protein [Dysgonomonas sp.]
MSDWYRKKTWTKEDEEYFYQKLKRAREYGRPQYLRIQAITLIDTHENDLLDVAEILLNKILEDYPENKLERSSAFHSLGDIYKLHEDYATAINYYKEAIDFEKKFPNVRTMAYLDYSELIIKTNQENKYNAIEKLLKSKLLELVFPIEKYKVCSILSIINKHNGKLTQAKEYAVLAEQYANEQTSGFRYHKYLGVVKERDNWLDQLVID